MKDEDKRPHYKNPPPPPLPPDPPPTPSGLYTTEEQLAIINSKLDTILEDNKIIIARLDTLIARSPTPRRPFK